jgi:hypothetical protein
MINRSDAVVKEAWGYPSSEEVCGKYGYTCSGPQHEKFTRSDPVHVHYSHDYVDPSEVRRPRVARACVYCDEPLHGYALEWDHTPIPKRLGGTVVYPACLNCHSWKDRPGTDRPGKYLDALHRMLSSEVAVTWALVIMHRGPGAPLPDYWFTLSTWERISLACIIMNHLDALVIRGHSPFTPLLAFIWSQDEADDFNEGLKDMYSGAGAEWTHSYTTPNSSSNGAAA